MDITTGVNYLLSGEISGLVGLKRERPAELIGKLVISLGMILFFVPNKLGRKFDSIAFSISLKRCSLFDFDTRIR